MGMSAGQARLLSITSRLSDNELRSQSITNAKLRLATESTDASKAYMEALNSTELVYRFYDDTGALSYCNLTPAFLYSYDSLKNQYSIQNSSGVNLVSSKDAMNYENTDSLYEFLACYMDVDSSEITQYEGDMELYNQQMEQYKKDMEQYNIDYAKYIATKAKYDKYLEDMEKYNVLYEKWLASQNATDLYAIFSGAVGTSTSADGTDASYCYYHALHGSPSCYLHLLNELLDFDGIKLETHEYTTTDGSTVTTNAATGGMWGHANSEMHQVSVGMNEKYDDGTMMRFCDGDDDLGTEGLQNILEQAKAEGREPTKLEILKSDYIDNGDGTYSLKSLKQKAIDMYYIIQERDNFVDSNGTIIIDANMMNEMLINFTDGDMKKLTLDEPKKPVEPEKPELPDKPVKPIEPEKPLYEIKFEDKEKAQWYTNLWYMMNGSDSVNLVKKVNTDNVDAEDEESTNGNFLYYVEAVEKNASNSNYKVIDENLLTSSEWLQFALENGIVTLKQAQYQDPSLNEWKAPEIDSAGIMWTSIIHTNASDFTTREDEQAIALAEVKYKNAMTEIENKDKKYDQDLKKLDTEHNALQTEYESIKNTIDKNVERSFKAFS